MSPGLWPSVLIFAVGVLVGMAAMFLIAVIWNIEDRTVNGETDPYQSRPGRSGR